MRRSSTPACVRALAALLLALASPACTVRLISPYDAETDHAVTALHRRVEALLTHVERTAGTPAGAFDAHAATYDSLRVDLRALRLRASARPQNELQAQQLATLDEQLGLLEEAHREGIGAAEVPSFRMGFDQSFRAVLTLELAKKRDP